MLEQETLILHAHVLSLAYTLTPSVVDRLFSKLLSYSSLEDGFISSLYAKDSNLPLEVC